MNIDTGEVNKFNNLAHDWWSPTGAGKLLHALNKPRLQFITQRVTLANKTVLDIGCGGGILTESLCRAGAIVTGIDAAPEMINIASQHAEQHSLDITYILNSVEEFTAHNPEKKFDVITCMEMLEHVPDFNSVIHACSQLLNPGGSIFLSTLNRTPKSYLLAILGAEYVLQLLPKQTHDYKKFIKPAELMASLNSHNLKLQELIGVKYNPLSNYAELIADVGINYLAYAT